MESAEMVRRYAHLAPEQIQRYAETVDRLVGGTDASQGAQVPETNAAQVLEEAGAG